MDAHSDGRKPEDASYSTEFIQSLNAFERKNNCSKCDQLRARRCNPLAKFEAARAQGEEMPICPKRRG